MEKVRNVSTKICDDIPPCYSTNHAQLEMATKKYADLFDEGEFDVSIQFRETFVETINMQSKSLYRSRAGSHSYGTECEIWADFGPVDSTKKSLGPIMSNF